MAEKAQAQATDNLALKKKARRRLVGTITLVILSLLILPQVLKNKSNTVKPQEPMVIMPQEAPDTTEPAFNTQPSLTPDEPVNESGLNTEAIAENLANEYGGAKPASTDEKPAQAVSPEPKSEIEADLTENTKEAVAQARETSAKADKASDSKKADKAAQKTQATTLKEPAKSKVVKKAQQPVSKAEKKAAKPTANKPVQGYAVQLGVFADPENVKKMQAKIALAGFESKTSTVSKGTRLRVGYFVSREGAEQALATLKQNGLSGKIVPR